MRGVGIPEVHRRRLDTLLVPRLDSAINVHAEDGGLCCLDPDAPLDRLDRGDLLDRRPAAHDGSTDNARSQYLRPAALVFTTSDSLLCLPTKAREKRHTL